MSASLRETARTVFAAAMQPVDVRGAVTRSIAVRDGMLHVAGQSTALEAIDKVIVVAMGKAAVPMMEAAAASLHGLSWNGLVVAPPETFASGFSAHVRYLPGAHPTPSVESLNAANAVLDLLRRVTGRTVVLFLVSGGASAMMERPLDPTIPLEDLAVFSRALVGSGLNIMEMNTLRKHLSAVKGGRLARAASRAAMQCTLLISDVPTSAPDAIASGPSLPDSTTVEDTGRCLLKLQQSQAVPASILRWLSSPDLPETPKAGDAAFARASFQVILSADHFAQAAAEAAALLGFHTIIDNRCDDWEYRDAARYLLDRSRALAESHGRSCVVSVGEVAVNVPVDAGEGGRNQHFALWCAAELARSGQRATVLSAGSDGVDGHSSAAGAVCDESTVGRAASMGLDVEAALAGFNSAPLLRAVEDIIACGPTGNNLRDLRLLLSE